MNEVVAANIITPIVRFLSQDNTSSKVQTTALQLFFPLGGFQDLYDQAQRAIAEEPTPRLVDRLRQFLQTNHDLFVLGSCLHFLEALIQENSTRALVDVMEFLLIFKSLRQKSYCPLEALCTCLSATIRLIPADNHLRELLIASKIFPSLLTFEGGVGGEDDFEDEYDEDAFYALGGSYYEPDEDLCFGIVAITKECVAIQDEQLIEHLVESGLFSYLLSKRMLHSYSCHEFVMEAAKSLVSFNDKYLEKIESMELAEEIMEDLTS
jgi:hypothetical protein